MTTTMRARATTYKGIKMRSRLEAGFAQWLDHWAVEWEYEPDCFASDDGQYLPDFRVDGVVIPNRPGASVYVEVKPSTDGLDVEELHRRMFVIKASDEDAVLVLQAPNLPPLVAGFIGEERAWIPVVWAYGAARSDASDLVLVQPLSVPHRPWPDGYWKGGV